MLHRHLPTALLCLVLLLAAGCSSRPTDFYMLNGSGTPVNAVSMPRTTLAIEQVLLPGYLDRTGIVVRGSNGTSLTVPRFSVWAEPLQQGVQRVLAEMLATPMLQAGITVLPYQTSNLSAWYSLLVEIIRFDADRSGLVQLESRWTLVDRNQTRVMARGNFAAEERVSLPEFGTQQMFDVIVEAESRLLQRLSNKLAMQLPAHVRSHEKDTFRASAEAAR